MSADGRTYEGHTVIFGQDADTEPSSLKPFTVAKAVNRVFRGGINRTRPPFIEKKIDFDNSEEEELFTRGNFQGWCDYKKKRPGRRDGIVVAVAGSIFFISLVNERFTCKLVIAGNDPRLLHTWFCQAEDWLYIQNGKNEAIFWDGQFPSTARRSGGTPDGEMPIGTIMKYIHGRVFLSNAYDQIAASDIIYGTGFTKTDNTQMFTENTYWAEGGNFGMPTELGRITGMIAMPRQGKDLRGQGELLIFGDNGAQSIEASVPRTEWKSAQIQTVTLIGRGCMAHGSLISVNNDAFFRSDDGIASYSSYASDQRKLSFGKISRNVNNWLDQDTPGMLQFCSSIYFDNRVLTTVSPSQSQPTKEEYGNHRYHRGIIALDLDKASGVDNDTSIGWDGLWTGVRPCSLIVGHSWPKKRAFAWSYDADGANRIYEISNSGLNDEVGGVAKQTEWFYITKRFDGVSSGQSNAFETKKLAGGEVWVSEISDRIKIEAKYRPDMNPLWTRAMKDIPVGSDLTNEWRFSLPRYKRITFQTPDEKILPGAEYPSNHGTQHQIMISGKGKVRVERMRISVKKGNDPNSSIGTDPSKYPDDPTIAIEGEIEDDYAYLIVEASS